MTDLFNNRGFRTVVREVFESLGGRCTHDELVDAVRHVLTMSEYQDWSDASFRQAVIRAAKAPVSEMGDQAVYSNDTELVTLRLFSVEEFTDKARQLARQSQANFEAIRQLAKVCEEIHGRSFDADEIIAEAV